MVIEKLFGLKHTSISLDERFTMLQTITPLVVPQKPRPRRFSNGSYTNQNFYRNKNRFLIEQTARQLNFQANQFQKALKQRLGLTEGVIRKFGSENNLTQMRQSNSFTNLSQLGVKSRLNLRNVNGNIRGSASFSNLSEGRWKSNQNHGVHRRNNHRSRRGKFRGHGMKGSQNQQSASDDGTLVTRTSWPGARGGRGRGRKRGGVSHNQSLPTKEELDHQLDEYMASSKSALDKELDAYMNMETSMDIEE